MSDENLGNIYATMQNSKRNLNIESDNINVIGQLLINGTNSRFPAEFENSIRNYLPLTYGTTSTNTKTLYDRIVDLSNSLLSSNNDASFNNVDISGTLKASTINNDTITLSTNSNGDINLTPDGIGEVKVGGKTSITGDLQVSSGDLTIGGGAAITGDLTVNGATILKNTTNYLGTPITATLSGQPTSTEYPGSIICRNINHPNLCGSSILMKVDSIVSTDHGVEYVDWRGWDGTSLYLHSFAPTLNAVSSSGAGIDLGASYRVWRQVWCKYLNVNGANITSDDRLKFNETPITNALTTVNKLKVYTYDKAEGLDNLTERSPSVGLIAQEVLAIPELAFAVSGGGQHTDAISGETKDIPYSLNYTDILVHLIEAVKELNVKVNTLDARITALGG